MTCTSRTRSFTIFCRLITARHGNSPARQNLALLYCHKRKSHEGEALMAFLFCKTPSRARNLVCGHGQSRPELVEWEGSRSQPHFRVAQSHATVKGLLNGQL